LEIATKVAAGISGTQTAEADIQRRVEATPTQPPAPTESVEIAVVSSDDNGAATFELENREITFYPVSESAPDSPLVGVEVQMCEQGEYVALYVQPGADSVLIPQFMLVEPGELAAEQRIILSEEIHFTRIDDIMFDPNEWREIVSLPAEDAGAYMVNEMGEDSLVLFVPVDSRGEVLVDIRGAMAHFLESPFSQVKYVWVEPPASSSRGGLLAAPVMNPLGLFAGHISIHLPPPNWPGWGHIHHALPHPDAEHILEDLTKFWRSLWDWEVDETGQVQRRVQRCTMYLAPGAPAEATELISIVQPIASLPANTPAPTPTDTLVPPTATPSPSPTPTDTPVPPTATPAPTPTPEDECPGVRINPECAGLNLTPEERANCGVRSYKLVNHVGSCKPPFQDVTWRFTHKFSDDTVVWPKFITNQEGVQEDAIYYKTGLNTYETKLLGSTGRERTDTLTYTCDGFILGKSFDGTFWSESTYAFDIE
jgi:hypothetical protein